MMISQQMALATASEGGGGGGNSGTGFPSATPLDLSAKAEITDVLGKEGEDKSNAGENIFIFTKKFHFSFPSMGFQDK